MVMDDVLAYLNHNHTLAAFTVQHQAFDHPKVHSIPLGIKNVEIIHRYVHDTAPVNKTQLLMMNFHERTERGIVGKIVRRNFNGTVNNTYGSDSYLYLKEMRQSKFVMSPSGLGWDCYRNWEALYMGSFPIIERYNRSDGWHRTLDGLPVLWVDTFHDLTPQLLESAYERLTAVDVNFYEYEKLTVQWWFDFVNSFRLAGKKKHGHRGM
jgi:hypothetical protein